MSDKYWALAPTENIAHEVMQKFQAHLRHIDSTGYAGAIRKLYNAYYNMHEDGGLNLFINKDRTDAKIRVNHFKALLERVHGMVTHQKLAYQPEARTSDSTAQEQSEFSKAVLEYVNDEKNTNEYQAESFQRALVMLEGYLFVDWNQTLGKERLGKDEQGQIVMENEGDLEFTALSVFDCARHARLKKSPYFVLRIPVNKFDEAAAFEGDEVTQQAILSSKLDAFEHDTGGLTQEDLDSDDLTYKYILIHNRTKALPKGRYTEIINNTVLPGRDKALPFKSMPVVKFTCSDMLEAVAGDSPALSLLALQEAADKLWSAVTTNNLANAKQMLWSPNAVQDEELSGGITMLTGAQKPESVQLTQSSPETYKLIESYQNQQETLSSVNKTVRGNPDSAVATAAGQALMIAQAIEFLADYQRQYVRAAGEVATIIIHHYQQFCDPKRLEQIGGLSRKAYVRSFATKSLNLIDKVTVDIGNPLTQSISGKYTLATEWIKSGTIKNPEKLVSFLKSGDVEQLTEDQFKDQMLIRSENEMLQRGELPICGLYDMHPTHFLEHKALASDPEFRLDAKRMKLMQDHLQEHIQNYKEMDPDIAALLGIPPLPSQMQPPPAPPGAQGGPNPPEQGQPEVQGQPLPNLPEEAAPETQEAYQEFLNQVPQEPAA